MRVLVAGSNREFNKAVIEHTLDGLHNARPITALIQTGDNGCERICRLWAANRNIRVITFLVKWHNRDPRVEPVELRDKKYVKPGTGEVYKKYNRLAQFNCNDRMIKGASPEMVLAFKGKGTYDIINKATFANIRCAKVTKFDDLQLVLKQLRREIPEQPVFDMDMIINLSGI